MKRGNLNQITISAISAMVAEASHFASSENRNLAIHHADTAGCGFCNRVAGRQNDKAPGQKTHGTRGALNAVEVLNI
jgi:hypothetical protein